MEIAISAGRHYGPEGLGDILERSITAVLLAKHYQIMGHNVVICFDWRHTNYINSSENVSNLLLSNKSVLDIPLINIEQLQEFEKIEGDLNPLTKKPYYAMSIDPYHGICLYAKHANKKKVDELLEIWNSFLSVNYNKYTTGIFDNVTVGSDPTFEMRSNAYKDLRFREDVTKNLNNITTDIAIHVRHGNGEFANVNTHRLESELDKKLPSIFYDYCANYEDPPTIHISTDSMACLNIIKHAALKVFKTSNFLHVREDLNIHGGALHHGYKGIESLYLDCAEMIQLSNTNHLIYGSSHFNLYANFTNLQCKKTFIHSFRA